MNRFDPEDHLAPPRHLTPPPKVIGKSLAFSHVLRLLERVAPTDRPVLISGPTGSGKEVVAQLIHHRGRDPKDPFVDLNCGALPENLVEAELFGYAKGAFTGAVASHAGHFERAGTGTLFLDEVGELPLNLQPKLLRVLETRTFRPLGSTEVRRFEGRLVAATHRDLEVLVREGKFREDLYYRLAVFVLNLPGLDERREDIPPLVSYFATLQPRPLTFSAEAMDRLQSHEWPGHVRQLRSLVDRLGVLAERSHIDLEDLAPFLAPASGKFVSTDALADALMSLEGDDKLAATEQLLINRAMALSGGNKTAAARMLGVSRKAIERRMQARDDKRMTAQQCLDEARRMIDTSEFREAIPLLMRGLELMQAPAVQMETQRMTFDLHRLLAVSLRSIDGWLSNDAKKADEAALKAGHGIVDEEELTTLLFGIWITQLMTMELGKARGTAQDMLQRAQSLGNAPLFAEAHFAMANTLFWLGDSAETLACLTRGGLVPVGQEDRTGPQGFDLVGLALTFEGLAGFHLGDFHRAKLAQARLFKRSSETHDHPFNRVIALQGAAWLSCLFEDTEALGPLATDLELLSAKHGFVFYRGIGQIFRGCFLAHHGQFDKAEEAINEGYETYVLRNGGKLFYSFQAWKHGELLLQAGKAEEADRLIAQALDVVMEHQDRAYLAELLDVQGRAKMAQGDLDGAEEGLRGALSTAYALGSVPARLKAANHLADLLARTNRVNQAADVLAKAVKGIERDAPFPGFDRALRKLGELRT